MNNKDISTRSGILLIAIIAVFVAVLVLKYAENNQTAQVSDNNISKQQPKDQQSQTQEENKNQEPQDTQNVTTDWQTYRNDKYSFELQYPSNFSRFLIGNENTNLDCVTFIDNEFDKTRDLSMNKIVDISIGAIKSCSTANSHYSGEGSSVKYLGQEKVKIGNHLFIKKQYQDVPMCGSECKAFKFYIWTLSDSKITLSFMYNSYFTVDPESHELEFEKILSTFKFLK